MSFALTEGKIKYICIGRIVDLDAIGGKYKLAVSKPVVRMPEAVSCS